jgi:hypothetical protein
MRAIRAWLGYDQTMTSPTIVFNHITKTISIVGGSPADVQKLSAMVSQQDKVASGATGTPLRA